jgi:hypothetical protein
VFARRGAPHENVKTNANSPPIDRSFFMICQGESADSLVSQKGAPVNANYEQTQLDAGKISSASIKGQRVVGRRR